VNYPDELVNVKHVYKVKFHIIRDNNGNRADFIGEDIVMNVIRDLNMSFYTGNIYFKYNGFEYIDDSNLRGNIPVISLLSTFSAYFQDRTTFHLFIINGQMTAYNNDGNLISVPGFGPRGGGVSFYSFEGITSRRVPSHEVGHNFGLRHNFSSSENAVRDENALGYNAEFVADRIHDKPACKIWSNNQFNSFGEYVGNDIDNNEALPANDSRRYYSQYRPKITNLMYIHEGGDLPINYQYTRGQFYALRHWISRDFTLSRLFYDASVSEVELYKPFESLMIGQNIVSITDNDNGTAEVCRNILIKDRYQKGFKMEFIEEDAFFLASTEYDLTEIISPIRNYFIKMIQINDEFLQKREVPCVRGTICETESYISGQIISTQILGSMNITIKELNEIEVKNPALFEELMNQYYHILKKMTSSGAVHQKVIYKP